MKKAAKEEKKKVKNEYVKIIKELKAKHDKVQQEYS